MYHDRSVRRRTRGNKYTSVGNQLLPLYRAINPEVRTCGRLPVGRRGVQSAATHARLASGLSGGRGCPISILKLTSMMVTTATGTPLYIAGW
jgi:hypothetical protein